MLRASRSELGHDHDVAGQQRLQQPVKLTATLQRLTRDLLAVDFLAACSLQRLDLRLVVLGAAAHPCVTDFRHPLPHFESERYES